MEQAVSEQTVTKQTVMVQETMENSGISQVIIDKKAFRKSVKKDASFLGWGLFIYAVLNFGIVIVGMIVELFAGMILRYKELTSDAAVDRVMEEILVEMEESAVSMIAAVLIGTAILFLFFFKSKVHKKIFLKKKKMTAGKFAQLTFVILGAQLVISGIFALMEWGLNLIGFSALSSMETATMTSQSISMFLYAGFIGPVVEEIIYRGYALRYLEKYGKVLAILISSFAFGIMHCNLPQDVGAMLVGLVLGYVAIEYSVGWSILLHILNNLVLGDLLSFAISGLDEQSQTVISYAIMIVLFIGGLAVLIYHRQQIKEYVLQNKPEKSIALWMMTAAGIIVFTIAHIGVAVAMIDRL